MPSLHEKESPDDQKTLGDRLRYMMDEEGLGIAEIQEICEVSTKTVYRWLKNEATPYDKALTRLSLVTGWKMDWLKSGNGFIWESWHYTGVWRERIRGKASHETSRHTENLGERSSEKIRVPIYEGAGAGQGLLAHDDPDDYQELTISEYSRVFQRAPGQDGVAYFRVTGDSAAPIYFDNELVPVEVLAPGTQQFVNDTVYVFRWRGSVMLKRLRLLADGRVRATSLNPSVDPFYFKPENEHDFAVLGRVIGCQKQQLYTALVSRAFAIQKQVKEVNMEE